MKNAKGRAIAKVLSAFVLCNIIAWGGVTAEASAKAIHAIDGTSDVQLVAEPKSEAVALPSDGMTNDELFARYAQKKINESLGASSDVLLSAQNVSDKLTGNDLNAYNYLKNQITLIASGDLSSSVIEIPVSSLTDNPGPWTAEELGVSTVVVDGSISQEVMDAVEAKTSFDISSVIGALLNDCPYELYWFDKTISTEVTGCSVSVSGYTGHWQISAVGNPVVTLRVAADYSATDNSSTTDLNITKTKVVSTTIQRAQDEVTSTQGLPVVDRLKAYKEFICNETSYNTPASQNPSTPYGNPWQLIWVFDNDPDTTVVCEGYAKAFKYLCDLSEFSNVECILVAGTMTGGTGAGAHMWNIVRMDDERNYLVDVTNCDGDPLEETQSIGYPDKLFMAYGPSGTWDSTYTFSLGGSSSISYAYDTETEATYSEEELTVSSQAYAPSFKSAQLVLTGQIGITFFVDTPQIEGVDYEQSYVDFHIGGKSARAAQVTYADSTVNDKGYRGFTFYVTSIEMAEPVTATLHYGENRTRVMEYSVKRYAEDFELFKKQYSQKVVSLVHAVANYGHYVQPFLSAGNKWTIGQDYKEMDTLYEGLCSVATATNGVQSVAVPERIENVQASCALALDSTTTFLIYLTPESGATFEASATFNGQSFAASKRSGRYVITISGIRAQQMDVPAEITGTINGKSFTIEVSPLVYVRNVLASEDFDNVAHEAMASLYYYYSCAKALS